LPADDIQGMKKYLPYVIGVVLIVGAFFGGRQVGKGSGSVNSANMTAEQRQVLFQNGGRTGGNRAGGANGGFLNGDIIVKDTQSITIKMRDGSSKIVFFSPTTEVSKFAAGTATDLEVGKTVSVNGKANPDGSETATTIQVRPPMPTSQTNGAAPTAK